MDAAYTVDQSEITGLWQVCHGIEKVTTCATEAEALSTAALMNAAWLRGKRHAQQQIRAAMGLRDYTDGTVTVLR